jgi:phosphoribosylformylglycinamidine synthase
VDVGHAPLAINATLFGESASRIIVSAAPERVPDVLERARLAGVPAAVIGHVGSDRIRLSVDGVCAVDVPVTAAEQAWASAIESKMRR